VILGTAGHIDHGKTTLVRALTGVDTDRLPEEKRRGITIELGFAPLEIEGVGVVGVVDVPGHEAFVRTMVAGATGIDLALVVVAADEGVMPQTREHLAILELLGVRRGVVALTKCDLADDEWLALVEEDVRAATRRALPDAPIIATSTVTGKGIDELRSAIAALARTLPTRASSDLFRMPVDRAFTIRGTGTVVTGTVWSGRLGRDETVRILPDDRTARVRGIQGHGSQLDSAVAGARTAVALVGVEVGDVPRGSTLVVDRHWRPTSVVRADITLVEGCDVAIRPRTWFRLHAGTSEIGARIVARDIREGEPFAARVVLEQPIVLRAGDRFVIRTSAPLNTIGGGVVVDPYPVKRARVWPSSLDASQRLTRLVEESGTDGLPFETLPVRLGLSIAECRALVAERNDDLALTSGRVVARSVLASLTREIGKQVDAYLAEHPLELGIPVQAIRARLMGGAGIVEAVLEAEISAGSFMSIDGLVARPGWVPTPTAEHASHLEAIASQLERSGIEPPSVGELSATLGADAGELLRFLERRGDVVQVEQDRYYTRVHLGSLVERLKARMAGGAEIGPSELREALGLSRKYLIPFLEYCDRVGYTSRHTGGRVWRGA
jgi:selenocysteine-specific elongation factor